MTDTPSHVPVGPIVVGTDGSPNARHAVLFALREAQLRGTGLRAVCAYDYTPARYTAYGWMAPPESDVSLNEQLRDIKQKRESGEMDLKTFLKAKQDIELQMKKLEL